MRVRQFVSTVLVVGLFLSGAGAANPPAKPSANSAQTLERKRKVLDQKIAGLEKALQMPEVSADPIIVSSLSDEWVKLSCQRKRIEAQQLLGNVATAPLLDKIEANCQAPMKAEAQAKFSSAASSVPSATKPPDSQVTSLPGTSANAGPSGPAGGKNAAAQAPD